MSQPLKKEVWQQHDHPPSLSPIAFSLSPGQEASAKAGSEQELGHVQALNDTREKQRRCTVANQTATTNHTSRPTNVTDHWWLHTRRQRQQTGGAHDGTASVRCEQHRITAESVPDPCLRAKASLPSLPSAFMTLRPLRTLARHGRHAEAGSKRATNRVGHNQTTRVQKKKKRPSSRGENARV